jgi:hypothetical protein
MILENFFKSLEIEKQKIGENDTTYINIESVYENRGD